MPGSILESSGGQIFKSAEGHDCLRLINGMKLTSESTLIESSSANDLNWPGAVGRSPSWPEAGLATKAASRSAIFFGKYSTRFMRRCPFYWSLRSPVPSSIINFSRKHQTLNVNSRTTRPAFLRAARVPTSPQSHPSKWRQRHRLPGVGCWQQSLREILRGSKPSSASIGLVALSLDSCLAVEGGWRP